jgi:hypothetical protein
MVHRRHLTIVPADRNGVPGRFRYRAAVSGVTTPADSIALLKIFRFRGGHVAPLHIGMIPERKLGVVILGNRGSMAVSEAARSIMLALAR